MPFKSKKQRKFLFAKKPKAAEKVAHKRKGAAIGKAGQWGSAKRKGKRGKK